MKTKKLIISLIIINLIVLTRIFYINQFKKNYYLNKYSKSNNILIYSNDSVRGRILDINGNILVDNLGIKSLIYSNINLSTEDKLRYSNLLGNILTLGNVELPKVKQYKYFYIGHKDLIDKRIDKDILEEYKKRNMSKEEFDTYVYSLISKEELESINLKEAYIYFLLDDGYIYQDKVIKEDLSNEEITKVSELDLKGLRIDINYKRIYNYELSLNELFGKVSLIPKEELNYYLDKGYSINDKTGISFLEKYYEEYLKGEKDIYKLNNDNTLSKVYSGKRGSDLVLNIDVNLVSKIDNILKEEIINAKKYPSSKYYNGSTVIISEAKTGNILSINSYAYNAGAISSNITSILTNSYTIGSVVKAASHTVAYKYGVLDESTKMKDSCVKLYSQKEKCSWKTLGTLNDINALAYSSNYFQFINAIKVSGNTYKRNMVLNPTKEDFDKYRNTFKEYGLGTKTNIDLYEEQLGITSKSLAGDLYLNLSIGQLDTYTPLQINQYINTIASDGVRYPLSLANSIIDTDGKRAYLKQEPLNNVNIDIKYLKRIQKGLNAVTTYGTASSYTKNIKSAGKTGTSETKVCNINTLTKTFIGYFPYDNPKYVLTIISPNIAIKTKEKKYIYPINKRITNKIINILFEKA